MKNQTPKVPAVPTVKSQLPSDEWRKRVESRIYRRKVGRFARFLKGFNPLKRKLSKEEREIAHYFLDAMTFDETRRQTSPGEKTSEKEKTLKDSVKY